MKILVADDDEVTRTHLRLFLEKMGHEIIECVDGTSVLAKLFKGELPQLILLDWQMPGMTGPSVCERIRATPGLPFTYVIFITSKTDPDDVIFSLRSGANDYITKPIRAAEFQARLQAALHMIDLNNALCAQKLKLIEHSRLVSLGEMAGGLAHETNTPLSIILAEVNLMTLQLKQSEKIDVNKLLRVFSVIEEKALRIAKIVEGLREFASEGERVPYNKVSLSEIVEGVLSLCYGRLQYYGIEIKKSLGEVPIFFEAQKVKIMQVILNLINNSVDALKQTETKWIHIEAIEDLDNVYVAVVDSGKGIAEENRNKSMQPFYTTKDSGTGLGLGLSISKGIMEAHNGEIKLDDSSRFTRFVLTIPKRKLNKG